MREDRIFVGIDLHTVFLQVAVVGADGTLLFDGGVENNRGTIHEMFSVFSTDMRCVVKSSSV